MAKMRIGKPNIITKESCDKNLQINYTGIYNRYNVIISFKDGKPNNEGKPAIIWTNGGTKIWCKNGLVHRKDGPAVIGGFQGRSPNSYVCSCNFKFFHNFYPFMCKWF